MFVYVSFNMFACKFRIDVLNRSLNDLNGEHYYISQPGDDAKIYCTETKCRDQLSHSYPVNAAACLRPSRHQFGPVKIRFVLASSL